jgi:2-hydroxychromene-2-carboxylate isomerase
MTPSRIVEFYFDPISPYAWLAARQCGRLDAAGVQLDFRPVLFGALLAAHGNKGPAELPAKRAYTMRDVLRIAAQLGVPVKGPPTHPFNPLRALRMCIALDDAPARRRFGLALMDAAWEHGHDLTDDAVLAGIARDCVLDGEALLARAGEADVKQRLLDATAPRSPPESSAYRPIASTARSSGARTGSIRCVGSCGATPSTKRCLRRCSRARRRPCASWADPRSVSLGAGAARRPCSKRVGALAFEFLHVDGELLRTLHQQVDPGYQLGALLCQAYQFRRQEGAAVCRHARQHQLRRDARHARLGVRQPVAGAAQP